MPSRPARFPAALPTLAAALLAAPALAQTGACCSGTGTCVQTTATTCAGQNGVYGGDNTTCSQLLTSGSRTFSATGLPQPVLDLSTITSTINVPAVATPGRIAINLNITHPYRGDLVVRLVGPDGASVVLANREGGSADNLILTDSALPPTFLTRATAGAWTLNVTDAAFQDTGWLNSWSLVFTPALFPCAGACCSADGTCTIRTAGSCHQPGDRFSGVSTACIPGDCVPSPGACCLPSGACLQTDPAGCSVVGGRFLGVGPCGACPVTLPTGACCGGVVCTLTAAAACTGPARYLGEGVACAPVTTRGPVNPCCPADFNNSGAVGTQDIFDFLAAFFTGCP